MSADYADRARALVGARFRPQGRDPDLGLDCVGMAIATFGIAAETIRRNYRLRGDHRAEIERVLAKSFRRVGRGQQCPGDLMLLKVGADQLHFGVRTDRGFVHADARLGHVVETPGDPDWPVIAAYRRRKKQIG